MNLDEREIVMATAERKIFLWKQISDSTYKGGVNYSEQFKSRKNWKLIAMCEQKKIKLGPSKLVKFSTVGYYGF